MFIMQLLLIAHAQVKRSETECLQAAAAALTFTQPSEQEGHVGIRGVAKQKAILEHPYLPAVQ